MLYIYKSLLDFMKYLDDKKCVNNVKINYYWIFFLNLGGDEIVWKEEIWKRMEDELNVRVREVLEIFSFERVER